MFTSESELVANCDAAWSYDVAGRSIRSPLQSVAIELTVPIDAAAGSPSTLRLTSAIRLSGGKEEADQPLQLAIWTEQTATDRLRFVLPRRPEELGGWENERLLMRKRLTYDPSDPRVDLSTGGSVLDVEHRVLAGLVVVNDDPVQTISIGFQVDDLPPGTSLAVEVRFGDLRRSLEFEAGQAEAFLDLISDKYADVDRVRCTTMLTIAGPGMTDAPLEIRSSRGTDVELPLGRLRVAHASLALPDIPAESLEQANRYFAGNRGD